MFYYNFRLQRSVFNLYELIGLVWLPPTSWSNMREVQGSVLLPPTCWRIAFRSAAAAETVQYFAAAVEQEATGTADAADTAGQEEKENQASSHISPPNYLTFSIYAQTTNWLVFVTKREEWALIILDTFSSPDRIGKFVDLFLAVLDEIWSLVR